MGRPFVFDVADFSGGVNLSPSANIGDNELTNAGDMYVFGKSLITREGDAFLAGPYAEDILSIFRYAPDFVEADEEYILLGCTSSLARIDGTGITALQVADGRSYPSLQTRWWFEQYGDEAFACRRGNGGLKRIYGDSVMDAGIPVPSNPPILTNGGPGKKTAGKYKIAYRFKNKRTGARGNWSPLSLPIDLPADSRIAVSSISASGCQQVNAREIGATHPDGEVLFLVGQIDDNTTTTFDENALSPDEYGEADVDVNGQIISDYRHGLPPNQAYAIAIHKERLFLLNKDGLSFSEIAKMQSFQATNFIPLLRGTGLVSWDQHGLVILRDGDAKILLGNSLGDFSLETLSKEHGCPAGKSAAVADGILFWYTGVNIVGSDGGAPKILGGIDRIRDLLDSVPEEYKANAQAETIPSRGLYILNLQLGASSWTSVVYDYKAGVFMLFPGGPQTLARVLRDNKLESPLAAFSGDYNVYDYLVGTTDSGVNIPAFFETKDYGYDRGVADKITRRVALLTNQAEGTVTIKVYHNDVLVYTRSGIPVSSAPWTKINMNTNLTPGSLVRVRVEYNGSAQFRVDQLQIEGVNLVRRVVPV